MQKAALSFVRLLEIMDELREKCPWDKKQTLQSLRHLTIEETYELSQAIMDNNINELKNELGDLLLHIIFYAKIASESNFFDINDVLVAIAEKLIRRHPHIYGETKAESEDDVKRNWEAIKLAEKGRKSGVLDGVPLGLPAMVKAIRIQEKAKGVGFDWQNKAEVWDKVQEEIAEFRLSENKPEAEDEFGDLLFALINYARFCGINPESALEKTNRKFINRFRYIENKASEAGQSLQNLTLEQMNIWWEEAKLIN